MNLSSKQIFQEKEKILEQYGFTYITDGLHLFLLAPTSQIGFMFNLIALSVLLKKKFNKLPVFVYLRIYTINSLCANLAISFIFLPNSYNYIEFTNCYYSIFYASYVLCPVLNFAVIFGSLLDVCISLERISHFKPKLKKVLKYSPLFMSLMAFIISIIFSSRYFFQFKPSYIEIKLNSTITIKLYRWINTEFSKTQFGNLTEHLIYCLRDLVLLVVQVILNVYSVNQLKVQLSKKKLMLKTSLCRRILIKNQSILTNMISNDESYSNIQQIIINGAMKRPDQKATIMVIILCTFSIMEHIFLCVMAIYFNIHQNKTAYLLGALGNLSIAVKHGANLVIFYFFNKIFKREFRSTFKKALSCAFFTQNVKLL